MNTPMNTPMNAIGPVDTLNLNNNDEAEFTKVEKTVTCLRNSKQHLLTDETFRQMDTPNGFKGIELLPHQKTALASLVDLEDKKTIIVVDNDSFSIYKSNALVLSEPFGSGKTFLLLALILARKTPKAIAHTKYINDAEVTIKYTDRNSLIVPTLILVGSAVYAQWEQAIKQYTDLVIMCVTGYHSIREFAKVVKTSSINKYHVILVRNSVITGDLTKICDPDIKNSISCIRKLTEGRCWSRVIWDDYETINLDPNTVVLPALSTIYVSASAKKSSVKAKIDNSNINNIVTSNFSIGSITKNSILLSLFNVRNTDRYVQLSTSIPLTHQYKYVLDNPNDNYIRLLGAMGDQAANAIAEMLNGDAVNTAAADLKVKTPSIAEIFKKVLDTKYEEYVSLKNSLMLLDNVMKQARYFEHEYRERMREAEGNRGRINHSQAELSKIEEAIVKNIDPKLDRYSDTLEAHLDNLKVILKGRHDKARIAIDRVIDNVREGNCQICCLPLRDEGENLHSFIIKCCGLILCSECGIRGNNLRKTGNRTSGKCSNCQATIHLDEHFILVDKNFDLEKLAVAQGTEEESNIIETVEEKAPEPEDPTLAHINSETNPKLKVVLQIMAGVKPEGGIKVEREVKGLIKGSKSVPLPRGTKPKVVIFAGFDETLKSVETCLAKNGYKSLKLEGKSNEMAITLNTFKTSSDFNVLLINSYRSCAGLNLQYATDMILMHKVIDPDIEAQMLGRVSRVGKQYDTNIHYLLYNNESGKI